MLGRNYGDQPLVAATRNGGTYPDDYASFPVENTHLAPFSIVNIPSNQVPKDLDVIVNLDIDRILEVQV